MNPPVFTIQIDSHLPDGWAEGAMRDDITRTFTSRPRILPPKWLYDDEGSRLFDQITRLEAYYPTEAERALLALRAADIAAISGASTVVELGSGTSDKTRTLLDAFWAAGQLRRFVPLDVSESTLIDAAGALAKRYPGLGVHAVVGDFTRHLSELPVGDRRLVAFLGGTVGNFYRSERAEFFAAMASALDSGEWMLLGIDLAKDIERILAAYDDADGVTEAFIRNSLVVLNRELDGDLDVEGFEYTPMWDHRYDRVDMRLRAVAPLHARLDALDLDIEFEEGEELRVEISTKFRPEWLEAELAGAGFDVDHLWTDDADDWGLILARRR